MGMSQLTCSFLMISFECLSSRAPFYVSAHVPISYDFLWMSQLPCSLIGISIGCLSPRDHFLRFPLHVSAHVSPPSTLPSRPPLFFFFFFLNVNENVILFFSARPSSTQRTICHMRHAPQD